MASPWAFLDSVLGLIHGFLAFINGGLTHLASPVGLGQDERGGCMLSFLDIVYSTYPLRGLGSVWCFGWVGLGQEHCTAGTYVECETSEWSVPPRCPEASHASMECVKVDYGLQVIEVLQVLHNRSEKHGRLGRALCASPTGSFGKVLLHARRPDIKQLLLYWTRSCIVVNRVQPQHISIEVDDSSIVTARPFCIVRSRAQ